jgi:hypothetical protein
MQLVSIAGVTLGSAITIETTGMSQDIPGAGATLDYRDVWRERPVEWTLIVRGTTRDAVMTTLDTIARAIYVAQHGRTVGDDGTCAIEAISHLGTVRAWLRDVILKVISVEQEAPGMVAKVAMSGTLTTPTYRNAAQSTTITASSFVPTMQTLHSQQTLQLLNLFVDTSPDGLTDAIHVIESIDTPGSPVSTVVINPATPAPPGWVAETFSGTLTRLRSTSSGAATITYSLGTSPRQTLYHIWLCVSSPQPLSVVVTSNAPSFAPQRIIVQPGQTWYRVGIWDYANISRTLTLQIDAHFPNCYVYPVLLVPITANIIYTKLSQYNSFEVRSTATFYAEIRGLQPHETYCSLPIIASNVIVYTHAYHLASLSPIETRFRAFPIVLSASM